MLRNAIAHGIEEPVLRQQAGKPETGQIAIHLRQEGNEVIITLSDDGRGLNLPRIREEAQRLGLIQENEIMDDDKAMSLIFIQGLSTTDSITGIAGRGIGLDIVKMRFRCSVAESVSSLFRTRNYVHDLFTAHTIRCTNIHGARRETNLCDSCFYCRA